MNAKKISLFSSDEELIKNQQIQNKNQLLSLRQLEDFISNTSIMIMENITDTFHEEISTDEKNSMNSNGKFKV